MTRKESIDNMTIQEALQVFEDKPLFGKMGIAKKVLVEFVKERLKEETVTTNAEVEVDINKFFSEDDSADKKKQRLEEEMDKLKNITEDMQEIINNMKYFV
jgi:hypothetical protein